VTELPEIIVDTYVAVLLADGLGGVYPFPDWTGETDEGYPFYYNTYEVFIMYDRGDVSYWQLAALAMANEPKYKGNATDLVGIEIYTPEEYGKYQANGDDFTQEQLDKLSGVDEWGSVVVYKFLANPTRRTP
jgi:hypothetical protein